MKIIEDIRYDLEDIIKQIKVDFGFVYKAKDDTSGTINLGGGYFLDLSFSEGPTLMSAIMKFPTSSLDITKSTVALDMVSSCSESAAQVVDLIKRMTDGGGSSGNS